MGFSPRFHASVVAVIVCTLVIGALLAFVPRVRAGAAIVRSDGFESGILGPQWTVNDSNAASGIDEWGVSGSRPHSGNYSVWCAQVGNQSAGPFIGQNNSAAHEYDDNMQADLSLNLSVDGYTSLFLSFYYYVRTENGGGDWLQAAYTAGGVTTIIFQHGGSSGNAWQPANLSVPVNIDHLLFRFHSDTANHGFEGAYVDDIILTGFEDVAPTSAVSALPAYTNQDPYAILYAAQDNANASGVAYVQLWYRTGTTGPFTAYTTIQNPLGQWASPTIPFDARAAAGDDHYEFYTVAVDRAGNVEPTPTGPDANITIDTTPPSLAINDPVAGALLNSSSVTVTWQATDALSGLATTATSLDGGAFVPTAGGGSATFTGLTEGPHRVTVQAADQAGNVANASIGFTVDTEAPVLTLTDPTGGVYLHTAGYRFVWTAYDNTTGIDHYVAWLDDGTKFTITESEITIPAIPEGAHTFHVQAVDRAGNVATGTVSFSVDRNPFSLTGPYDGIPLFALIGLILALLLFLLFLWRRRKEDEEERTALEAAAKKTPESPTTPPASNDAGGPKDLGGG